MCELRDESKTTISDLPYAFYSSIDVRRHQWMGPSSTRSPAESMKSDGPTRLSNPWQLRWGPTQTGVRQGARLHRIGRADQTPVVTPSLTITMDGEESRGSKERRPVEKPIEPPAGRFPQVEAGHAGTTAAIAAGIERAAGFAVHQVVQKAMQVRLKDSLQPTEHEFSSDCSIDDEG